MASSRRFKLILGTPVRATPKPWLVIDVDGVMVNAYELLSSGLWREVRGSRLRKQLGLSDDVELWIDSGGYQFLRRNVSVSLEKLARLYREVDADYYVSLDYPPSPKDPPHVKAVKIARTVEAFNDLRRLNRTLAEEGRLVPVFHMAAGSSLKLQLNAYVPHATTAAAGGLVPYFMQLAGRFSRMKAITFLALLRRLWGGRLHALGLASAAIIPILKAIGVDSGDTQSWRHKAAYGKIVIPGTGERHVSGRDVKFGPAKLRSEDYPLLHSYVQKASSVINVSVSGLAGSFEERALFNAWVLMLVATGGISYTGPSPTFRKLQEEAAKLAAREPSELEEMLMRMMGGCLDTMKPLTVEAGSGRCA